MTSQTNLSRRRTTNLKSDQSSVESEDVADRGYMARVKILIQKCGLILIVSLIFMFAVLDLLPGIVSPFGFSTRRWGRFGRRHMHVRSEWTNHPEQITNAIQWKEWEHKHQVNESYPYARSMVNRHLFGIIPQSSMEVSSSVIEDRASVARVMVFKLPRSGSTWFTELLNALPSVFISKEIIQAEFDAKYTQHERLRHLKRSLIWPTGKMSTGPWGGRFSSVNHPLLIRYRHTVFLILYFPQTGLLVCR